jgi:hypothetical protein
MGLVGVFVALIMPNFNKVIPQMKVDKAAFKLAADLRMAQQKAIEEMALCNFRVEVSQNRYYAMIRSRGYGGNPTYWWRDGYDDYLEDPLRSGSILLVDYDEPSNHFQGVDVTGIQAPGYAVSTYGFYFSQFGDLRWPFTATTITLADPGTGYYRQVQISYPLGKVMVLP